jgi:Sugar-transfer associated ATP-grasp
VPDRPPILKAAIPRPTIDVAAAMAQVAVLSGRSQGGIALDLLGAMLGRRRLHMWEYFVQGAWIGNRAERSAFIGETGNHKLHRSLTAPGALDQWDLMSDKFRTDRLLAGHGLPVPSLKAVFATAGAFDGVTVLDSAEALANWLRDQGNLPAFAKPVCGTMALGAVPLMAAGVGEVDIGGQAVSAQALAAEVAALYPTGWLIQEQLRHPPEIEARAGPGIGSVRVVTLWEASGPQVLYGVWRHPAVGTWVDAAIHGRANVGCALDASGTVRRAQFGDLLTGHEITHSLIDPALPLVGYQLEQWPAMTEICIRGHHLFPGHALLGWDIAMTGRGPVISEVNANPMHLSFQRAFRAGFLNREHRERLAAARRLMRQRAAKVGQP